MFSSCKILTTLNAVKPCMAAVPNGKRLLCFSKIFHFLFCFPKKTLADEDRASLCCWPSACNSETFLRDGLACHLIPPTLSKPKPHFVKVVRVTQAVRTGLFQFHPAGTWRRPKRAFHTHGPTLPLKHTHTPKMSSGDSPARQRGLRRGSME